MSRLLEIYQTLAETPIAFTSGAQGPVEVYGTALDETPDAVESAQLPTRLLQPFGGRGDGRVESFYTAPPGGGRAGVITVDWGISDMLFWRAAAAGVGLSDVSADMVRYMAAYAETITALRNSKWSVTAIVLTVDCFEWPADSKRLYDGVIAQLTIREIIP